MRTQIAARDCAGGGVLDGDAGRGIGRRAARAPVADGGLRHTNNSCQSCDAAEVGDSGINGAHSRNDNASYQKSNPKVINFCYGIQPMETIGKRLARLRKEAGLSQAELAKRAGLSGQGSIGNIERDSRGYGASVVVIAGILGTTPEYLQTGAGPMHPGKVAPLIDLENNPDYPAIRRVRFKLSAGLSGYGIDYDAEEDAAPIVFQRQWYERHGYRPERLLAVRVANGSMEPGLWHGDTVVVNLDATDPVDGSVFAVNYEGHLTIKRLVRDAGQWWLTSDNPDKTRYPRKVCDEHAFLLGRIVHKQSEKI